MEYSYKDLNLIENVNILMKMKRLCNLFAYIHQLSQLGVWGFGGLLIHRCTLFICLSWTPKILYEISIMILAFFCTADSHCPLFIIIIYLFILRISYANV